MFVLWKTTSTPSFTTFTLTFEGFKQHCPANGTDKKLTKTHSSKTRKHVSFIGKTNFHTVVEKQVWPSCHLEKTSKLNFSNDNSFQVFDHIFFNHMIKMINFNM